ncbi:MAG TPA: hypothetical protein DCP61_07815 [Treponema sp.]|nr:hypothetical protein [Treponema sp.]
MPPTANAGGRKERTGGERMKTVQLSPSPEIVFALRKKTFVKQGIFVLKRVELPGVSADQREEEAAGMPPAANAGGRKERTGGERMETFQMSSRTPPRELWKTVFLPIQILSSLDCKCVQHDSNSMTEWG